MNATEALNQTENSEAFLTATASLTEALLEAINEATESGCTTASINCTTREWDHAANVVLARFQAKGFVVALFEVKRYDIFQSLKLEVSWGTTYSELAEREASETKRSEKEQA